MHEHTIAVTRCCMHKSPQTRSLNTAVASLPAPPPPKITTQHPQSTQCIPVLNLPSQSNPEYIPYCRAIRFSSSTVLLPLLCMPASLFFFSCGTQAGRHTHTHTGSQLVAQRPLRQLQCNPTYLQGSQASVQQWLCSGLCCTCRTHTTGLRVQLDSTAVCVTSRLYGAHTNKLLLQQHLHTRSHLL